MDACATVVVFASCGASKSAGMAQPIDFTPVTNYTSLTVIAEPKPGFSTLTR